MANFVEIDLNGDGTAETDITQYTIDVYISRGRSEELAGVQVGLCTMVMKNSDGRFNPDYASGAYYGDLAVGNKVAVRASVGANNASLFTGYIKSFRVDVIEKQVVIDCHDLFAYLREFHLNLAMATDKTTGDRIDAILSAFSATVAAAADTDTGQTTLPLPYWRNTDALSALQECADHELGGMIFIAGDGAFVFRDRHARALSASEGTITSPQGIDYSRGEDQVYTKAILQGGGHEAGVAGSQIYSYSPLPVLLAQNATLVINPNYTQPATAVTTPVSGTDFVANVASDGTGTDLTSDMASTFTNYGGGASWSITNNSPNNVWLRTLQVRGTPLGLPAAARTATATGTGSSPFEKTYEQSFRMIDDLDLLQSFADYIVSHYNEPQPQLRVTLRKHSTATSDNNMINMIKRELNDRVTITDTGFAYSSQINGDFFIEAITHRLTDGARGHETTWTLSTFSNDAFFILDTSLLDGEAVLSY